jgi:5-methylcytosine-specific restriction endonuclease McrA
VFKALEQKFCSFRCYLDNRKAVANPADVNAARCLVAPGLTDGQRARLMEKWRRQCRSCSYCPRPATTVDHVLPLILGGTNYEGNLAPCCKSCNSSKGARLLVKWRRSRALVLQGSNPS